MITTLSSPGRRGEGRERDEWSVVCGLVREADSKMRLMSTVDYPANNRRIKIFSNQPGLQFYTGNFLPREGMLGKVCRRNLVTQSGVILISCT